MNKTTRAALDSAYAVIDEMIFAPAAEIPALTVVYQHRFTAYAAAVKAPVATCDCALCGTPSNDLDVLTDYTYMCVTRSYSLEHDDMVCGDCREEFEHQYGRHAPDRADHGWDDR